jgi:hypothetical protein
MKAPEGGGMMLMVAALRSFLFFVVAHEHVSQFIRLCSVGDITNLLLPEFALLVHVH